MTELAEYERLKAPHKVNGAAPPSPDDLPLRFWTDLATPTPPDRLVKRLLGETALALIIGKPGSGKTFLISDLGFHLALGRQWFGRTVLAGAVLYVAAEGQAGISNRVAAFRGARSTPPDVPFVIVPIAVNLGPSGSDANAVIAAAARVAEATGLPVRLIVVDTLARCTPAGDENSAQDMGTFVAACDRIRLETGATVAIVHHTAKAEGAGARGSSALLGAVDTAIEVEKREGGRVARIIKQKDGEEGQEFGFTLDVVEIGVDDEGDPITSCVVVPTDKVAAKRPKLTPLQKRALDVLHNALLEAGEPRPDSVTFPNVTVLKLDLFREHLKLASVTDRDTPATERQQWKRLLQNLQDAGVMRVRGDYCWSAVTKRDTP